MIKTTVSYRLPYTNKRSAHVLLPVWTLKQYWSLNNFWIIPTLMRNSNSASVYRKINYIQRIVDPYRLFNFLNFSRPFPLKRVTHVQRFTFRTPGNEDSKRVKNDIYDFGTMYKGSEVSLASYPLNYKWLSFPVSAWNRRYYHSSHFFVAASLRRVVVFPLFPF